MRILAIVMVGCLLYGNAYAQTTPPPTCKSQASDKKLSGAARTSFNKKCVIDAVGN
jgi:hypothetical protein